MIEVQMKGQEVLRLQDDEAWAILLRIAAQIDISFLKEADADAAGAVAEKWEEELSECEDERLRDLDLGTSAPTIVANAVQTLIWYSRALARRDLDLGTPVGTDFALAADGGGADPEAQEAEGTREEAPSAVGETEPQEDAGVPRSVPAPSGDSEATSRVEDPEADKKS